VSEGLGAVIAAAMMLAGAFAGWLLRGTKARRQRKIDASTAMWVEAGDFRRVLMGRIEALEGRVDELERENADLHVELAQAKAEAASLRAEVVRLKSLG
jgi:predicted RNase H-like nuclease (RuvC/YqgF family)